MLDSIRRGQRWLTGLFIAVIGGVFVFFMGFGGPPQGSSGSVNSVVVLDDIDLTTRDFFRIRQSQEERFRQSLGDDYDAKAAAAFLDQQSLRSMIEMALLAHSARELGLRVSKQEVQDLLKRSEGFRDAEGRFDQEGFREWAAYNYGNQKLFLDAITLDLLRSKMVQLLIQQPRVSDGEAIQALRYQTEDAKLVYAALDTVRLPAGEQLDDDAIAAYLAENESHVRELYDQRSDEFQTPESATARHILVKLAQDADEAAQTLAHETLATARARIEAGESFETVAAELSEDEATRENGGALGAFGRGEGNPVLAEASFSLEIGALSDALRSPFGLHLLRVDGRSDAGVRPFDEVKLELAGEAAETEAASERANRLADELKQAIADGSSLEDAARDRGLTLERPAAIRRRPDGYIPGLGASAELMAEAFALEAGQSSQRVFTLDSKLVLIEVAERTGPDQALIDDQLEAKRSELERVRQDSFVRAWVDARQRELDAAGRLYINADLVTGT